MLLLTASEACATSDPLLHTHNDADQHSSSTEKLADNLQGQQAITGPTSLRTDRALDLSAAARSRPQARHCRQRLQSYRMAATFKVVCLKTKLSLKQAVTIDLVRLITLRYIQYRLYYSYCWQTDMACHAEHKQPE